MAWIGQHAKQREREHGAAGVVVQDGGEPAGPPLGQLWSVEEEGDHEAWTDPAKHVGHLVELEVFADQRGHGGAADIEQHELVAAHEVSQPAISRHLRALREAGLVSVRQHGRRRHYRVQADGLLPLISYLTGFWDQRLTALESVLHELEEQP